MSTTYHAAIANTKVAANADTFNVPLGALDAQLVVLTNALAGGAAATAVQILAWAAAEAYQVVESPLIYDATYPDLLSNDATNTITWPDGSTGELAVTAYDTTWIAVKSFTLTHAASGKTVTQSAIMRDATGNVTIKPALTIA